MADAVHFADIRAGGRGRWRARFPPPHLLRVLLGFALAAASFIGATVYVQVHLGVVARESREFGRNGIQSMTALGRMRRHIAHVEHILDAGAEGARDGWPELQQRIDQFEDDRRTYEALPRFPDELPLWTKTSAALDRVQALVPEIRRDVEAGAIHVADERVMHGLTPAAREADDDLAQLIHMELDHGTDLADRADAALAHSRRWGVLLDGVSLLFTFALALTAWRAIREHDGLQQRRVEEFGAFASSVAHDIRGPLQAAILSCQMIASRPDMEPDTRRVVIERGKRSLQRLEALTSDLLTFARASGRPEPGVHAPLAEVVGGVVQDVEPLASESRIRIEAEGLPGVHVVCARGVLASIVSNLVNNAIKYMPAEWPERRICIRASSVRGRVRVEVCDTGAGLTESEQSSLFEPYVRMDKTKPGLGLGLATVRRLVEAHGGAVGVRSRKGKGAVFWFELPQHEER